MVWTNALTRPRISSATCGADDREPGEERDAREPPTSITAAMARNRCGASGPSTSASPPRRSRAEQRLCGMRRRHPRGGTHAEAPSPMKTDAKSTPYGGVASRRGLRVERGRADDDAAAAKAPMMP
jgi:hypothetical protein